MELGVAVLFGLAVLVVLATSLFKHVEWSHRTKALLATVLSVVAAAAATAAAGVFDPANLVEASVALYGVSQAFYHLIFHGTVAEDRLEAVGSRNDD